MDFRIPGPGFQSLFSLNLDSGFHSFAGFRIPLAVFLIPKPRIPDSTINVFLGFPNMGRKVPKNSLGMTHDVKSSWRVVPEAGFFSASLLVVLRPCV